MILRKEVRDLHTFSFNSAWIKTSKNEGVGSNTGVAQKKKKNSRETPGSHAQASKSVRSSEPKHLL